MPGSAQPWLAVALVALLVPIVHGDLARRLIPNRLTAAGALVALALVAIAEPGALPAHVAWGAGAGAALVAVHAAAPDGIGMGDVKLVAMLGLFLADAILLALLAGLVAAGVAGLALIARDGPARARAATLPLAPFLALGAGAALLAG